MILSLPVYFILAGNWVRPIIITYGLVSDSVDCLLCIVSAGAGPSGVAV